VQALSTMRSHNNCFPSLDGEIDMGRIGLMVSLLALSLQARACWQEAGSRYDVDPGLLHAIARTESGLNATALNRNKNGSMDIGLMQINSSWLPELATHGISAHELWNPCVNIHVGAWVLSKSFRRLGMNWDAVGAYNARSRDKRIRYAWKVYANLDPSDRSRKPSPSLLIDRSNSETSQ